MRRIREGEFDAIHVATPCSSFSINHDEALRTLPSPEGVKPMIPGYEDYITHHNVLAGGALLKSSRRQRHQPRLSPSRTRRSVETPSPQRTGRSLVIEPCSGTSPA